MPSPFLGNRVQRVVLLVNGAPQRASHALGGGSPAPSRRRYVQVCQRELAASSRTLARGRRRSIVSVRQRGWRVRRILSGLGLLVRDLLPFRRRTAPLSLRNVLVAFRLPGEVVVLGTAARTLPPIARASFSCAQKLMAQFLSRMLFIVHGRSDVAGNAHASDLTFGVSHSLHTSSIVEVLRTEMIAYLSRLEGHLVWLDLA